MKLGCSKFEFISLVSKPNRILSWLKEIKLIVKRYPQHYTRAVLFGTIIVNIYLPTSQSAKFRLTMFLWTKRVRPLTRTQLLEDQCSSRTDKHVTRWELWDHIFSQLKELPNYCFKCYHIFEIQNNLSEGPFVFSFMSPSQP